MIHARPARAHHRDELRIVREPANAATSHLLGKPLAASGPLRVSLLITFPIWVR